MATATIYCTKDAMMDAVNADTNFGSWGYINVGREYAGGSKSGNYRGIGNFDVSSLAGATINAAELHRVINGTSGGGFAAHLARCTRPTTWTEPGVTWNKYDGVNAWTTGGGDTDAGLNFAYTEASTTGEHTITGLLTLVEDALANRDGIVSMILRQDTDPGVTSYVQYHSLDPPPFGTDYNWWLVIDYTPPPGGGSMRNYWP